MWYCEWLILNRDLIRNRMYGTNQVYDTFFGRERELCESSSIEDDEDIYVTSQLDNFSHDDLFDDLMTVETAINRLREGKAFSIGETRLLDALFTDEFVPTKQLDTLRLHHFSRIMVKLATVLDETFTDKGYLEHMRNKYNLTDEQVLQLEKYMLSVLRNRSSDRIHKSKGK